TVVARLSRGGAVIARRNHDAPAVGIEEYLARVEAHPVRRIERALDAIAVQLPGPDVRDEYVPVVVRAVGYRIEPNEARGLWVVDTIEQEELYSRCVSREQAPVDATEDGGRAQRRAAAFPDGVTHCAVGNYTLTCWTPRRCSGSRHRAR